MSKLYAIKEDFFLQQAEYLRQALNSKELYSMEEVLEAFEEMNATKRQLRCIGEDEEVYIINVFGEGLLD